MISYFVVMEDSTPDDIICLNQREEFHLTLESAQRELKMLQGFDPSCPLQIYEIKVILRCPA